MMKSFLLFVLTTLAFVSMSYSQTNFTISSVRQVEHAKLDEQFREYQTVRLDHQAFYQFYRTNEGALEFGLQTDRRANLQMNLAPYELRSDNFRRFTADGGRVQDTPATRTSVFRGSVSMGGNSTGEAIFTFDEQFVLGRWDEGESTYFLEPLWRFVPGADRELYVIYEERAAIIPEGFCGANVPAQMEELEHRGDHDHDHDHAHEQQNRSVGECLITELALASDFELYQDFGSNATSVENFMLNNLANVQTNYDDEFADEILFEVVTTFIATCSATSCDPWTNSTNAGTLLNDFTDWGNGGGFGGVTYDVATLWSGRNFNGGTIGVAWLSGLCSNLRYNTCENFSSNSQTLRVLWSHELGHNFGSGHDNSGTWIMSPSVNTSTQWSTQSQNAINNLIASVGCLSSCGSIAPPTAFIDVSTEEACTGSYVAFFDESDGTVTNRFWDFPGGTPSFSTDPHPIVYYENPGTYSAFLQVENSQGDDFTDITVFIDLDDEYRKVIHYANFEDGFDGWGVENPDNDVTWELVDVEGNLGGRAAWVDNFDYDADGEIDGLVSPFFDLSAEANVRLSFEYAYARFNSGLRDQLRVYVSTDGGNTFPNLIFEGDETGGGNFATAPDQNSRFNPSSGDDWCGISPSCIDLDLSAFAGESDVVIMIENVNGFGNSMFVDNIELSSACGAVEPPTANFSQDREIGCAPLVVAFQDESEGVITDWEWTFENGDPDFSFEQNPFSEWTEPGVYEVSLTVSNSLGGDTYTVVEAVTVLGPPATADFSYTNTGLTYDFTDLSSADAEDWAWDFGDGGFSFEQNPTHTYAEPGTYEVELEVFNSCGSTITNQTIVVEPVLRADFISTEAIGCSPLEVKFIDLSEGEPDSWFWEFSGGTPATSDEQNPTIIYNEPGVYDVSLTITAGGETDEITMQAFVQVLPLPTASFTAMLAPGQASPMITNTSTDADSYSWDFGNGDASTEENPSVTYTEAGTYTITLTATNECGSSTATQEVEVIFPVEPSFTATETEGCVPFTTTFMAVPQGEGLTYEWEFEGGSPDVSTDPNPVVTYDQPGSYNVSLTITNAAGPATVVESDYIVVNDGPTAAFEAETTPGSLTVDLTDLSTNADNVSWDFGDGTIDDTNPTSYTYAEAGTYTIRLTAENECGTDVATQDITLVLPVTPVITASVTEGCTPLTVEFSAGPEGEGQTYLWQFTGGDPVTSTDPNVSVTYTTPGVFDVSLTIANAAGSETTTEMGLISVGQGPEAAFTVDNTLGSADISLTNNSSFADSYEWFFGDGNMSTATEPSHTYNGEGTYEIMLVATNECGTDTARQMVEIIFVPEPTITATVSGDCAPVTVVYEASPMGEGFTYAWDFPGGDPSTSDEAIVTVVYAEAGTYAATLTVTNAAGSASTMLSDDIVVLPLPMVSFTSDYVLGAQTVTFTSTSENVTELNWDFGDGAMATGTEVMHTYTEAGEYVVTLTGTGPCGEDVSTQTVVIVLPPAGGFTADATEGCVPFEVNFTAADQGDGFTYAWTFAGGDPGMSTAASPTVTYDTPGTYDVTLVVTNAAGSVTTTEEGLITVGDVPPAFIDLETELGSLMISVSGPDSPNIDEWQWNFGDGNEATGVNATHTYAASGTYTITLTTTNECGTATATTEVTVLTAPAGTFTASTLNICPGETILFAADETEGVTYSWDIPGGDPSSSTDASVGATFAVAGTYEVSLSVTNAAGTTTTSQTVVVNELPVADFFFTTNGLTASFTNTSLNATSFVWIFPGNDSTEENPEYTFPGVGTYEVTLLAGNDCGEDSRTLTVEIAGEIPSVNFTAENNEGCSGLTVSFFSMTEGADEIMWSFPGGTPSTSTDPNPMVSYENPGVYTVTLMASNAFGTNAITQEAIVTIYEEASASVSFDLVETTATFSADATAVTSFTWTFPDGSTSTMEEPSYTFPGNGTYTVLYTYSGPCGQGEISTEVVIDGALPVIDVQTDVNTGCGPLTVSFTDASENNPTSWSWSFPGGDPETSDEQMVFVTYDTPGVYSASLTVSNVYGSTTMELTDVITVLAAPAVPSFTANTADDITFDFAVTDAVAGVSYSWDFGDDTTGDGEMTSHTYTEDGMYEVTLTATNECGSEIATTMVTVIITSTETPLWTIGLQLAPNPTPNWLHLTAQSWPETGELRYRLINTLGQQLEQGLWPVSTGNWRQSLDISRLPAGTYLLQLGWQDEVWTQKVIKQ